ncbi:hypothetical protein Rumeso_01371 [Rubellimicrobium mesophilum DSM 19309]|uniref:Uncharacterized protein n=1 Tax=Rubellimicrobium mesophilum DSM 19309 TaxID=442562 RepID=A0A017HRK8_9RHOB|nr:hypothetical protein [Rubellimicrobium mesophilum]EYD77112.1 hypothetical protein Rumeso_01371 [Rubellimicrobium mesophilum DSM 19309]
MTRRDHAPRKPTAPEQGACRYLVVQIDQDADVPRDGNETLTGHGVLVPRNADGFYRDLEDAQEIAEYMNELHPQFDTYVLEVVHHIPRGRR